MHDSARSITKSLLIVLVLPDQNLDPGYIFQALNDPPTFTLVNSPVGARPNKGRREAILL